MKFKKVLSAVCAALVTLSLAACSGGQTAQQTGKNGVTTLSWLIPGDKQADQERVMAEVNKIAEDKLGVHFDIQFIDAGAYTERMTMKMASGDNMDLFFTGFINPYNQAAENGGLLQIDELLDTVPALKNSVPQVAWDGAKYKDHIYAVPNMQVMNYTVAVQFKKDLVDKYNFDVSSVKHINDIEPFLEQVKNGEPSLYPYRTNYGITPWICSEYETINGDVAIDIDDGSKAFMRYDTPEFKEGVYKMHDWFKKGYIRPDVASVTDDTQDYNAGKYAVSLSTWKPGQEEIVKASLGYEVVYAKLNAPYVTIGAGTGAMTGISKKCKNPELAIKAIELVNTDKDLYNLICFGLKDVHYKLTDENKVQYIDGSGYAPKADWKFGNQFNALLLDGQQDDLWEVTQAENDGAKPSPLLGFSLSTEDITNEISQCSSVSAEYKVLNCGAENPDTYYDEFIQKMKVAGSENLLKEVQSQIDAFLQK